jgi:outer membrane receptor protein involved in Fe transport
VKYIITFSLVLISLLIHAQKGTIRGTVFDDANGESLVGVNVVIKGTSSGSTTDLDGKFSIDIAPGNYELQISYISYQTLTVQSVVVTTGQVTVLNNLKLKTSTQDLTEVVISAKAVRTTESSLMTVKKKSATIMDGISADRMQLTGDGNAVEAAKRVTGVSVEGGKYVYIRGLGDRYSKTTLNQMDIPGLDPDKNSLQMDLFPTNLIDNIMVSKNFTAELPADFTGGLLNVETKDFPEEKIMSFSFSTGYNPNMHFNSNYLTYKGSSTDFLGFDNGTRELPALATSNNIPTPISGATRDEVNSFVKSFSPTLGASQQMSLMDYSASFSFGNQINLKKKTDDNNSPKIGYIFSASYKSEQKYYDDIVYGEYQRFIDPNAYEMRYATIQQGEMGEKSVLIGLLGGIAYKTELSKIRLTAMHLQNGESRAAIFNIENDGQAVGQSGYKAISHNLEYNQRSLSNLLLNGTHVIKKTGWEIDWRISPTFSSSEDPDIRKTAFTFSPNGDITFSAGAGGNPSRIWRSLNEINASSKIDLTKKYQLNKKDAKLRFGLSHTYKNRSYEVLFFDIQFFSSQSFWTSLDPNEVLNPINIYPNKPNSIYYQSGNNDPNPNQYNSNINNTAFYISNEMELFDGFKTIIGVRAENYVQRHTGRDQSYASGDTINGSNLDNKKVLESLDFFPTINIIYALSNEQNLRFSYAKTIARPSFKELSYAQILDPISNRIFNGSLFTYGDWDGNLIETRIDNVDFRWELFLKRGQIFSISGFYKKFDNPIELVRIPEQQTSSEYQTRNVGDGQLYGVEIEFRKDLDFIAPILTNYNLSGNITLVESQIDMTDIEYNSRKSYEKTGETISKTRQMAGQSPYVINAGITYNNPENGLNAGFFYNVKGPTLFIVGAGLFPDIYQEPFHSLNFSLNKKIGKNKKTVIDFKVSNILNDKNLITYQSYLAENQIFESRSLGMNFSLGIAYKF